MLAREVGRTQAKGPARCLNWVLLVAGVGLHVRAQCTACFSCFKCRVPFQWQALSALFTQFCCHAGPPMERGNHARMTLMWHADLNGPGLAPLWPATTAGHCVLRFLNRPRRLCRLPERAAPCEPRWTTANTLTPLMTQASSPSALQMESVMADWCQIGAPPSITHVPDVVSDSFPHTGFGWPTFHSLGFFGDVDEVSAVSAKDVACGKCFYGFRPSPGHSMLVSGLVLGVSADWDRTTTRQVCLSISPHPLVTLVFLLLLALSPVIFDAVSATNANLSQPRLAKEDRLRPTSSRSLSLTLTQSSRPLHSSTADEPHTARHSPVPPVLVTVAYDPDMFRPPQPEQIRLDMDLLGCGKTSYRFSRQPWASATPKGSEESRSMDIRSSSPRGKRRSAKARAEGCCNSAKERKSVTKNEEKPKPSRTPSPGDLRS